jgi:uncharacterized protein (TIGR03435 family)
MSQVSEFLWLTGALDSPVVDLTNLKGNYGITLIYDTATVTGTSASSENQYGSIYNVLQQVGLKLVRAKVPLNVLHIDSVSRPSVE